MNKKDFTVLEENGKIVDIKHNEFDVIAYQLEEEERAKIIQKAIDFVIGNRVDFRVWSDYDAEEASDACYFWKDRYNIIRLIEHMEPLIIAIKTTHPVWIVHVEDNLI